MCSGENPGLGAKEVQEMMLMQWTRGKVGVAKEKKVKKVVGQQHQRSRLQLSSSSRRK